MKLKSAEFIAQIKATFTQLKSVASFSIPDRIVAAAQTGNFLLFTSLFDEFYVNAGMGTSDAAVLNFFKTLTDDAGAADAATNAFMKALSDRAALSDGIDFVAFGKNFQNPSVVAEAYAAHIQKSLGDTFKAADDAAKLHPGKVLSDANTITDVVNTLSVGLTKADISLAADLSQRAFGKNAADAANLADVYRHDASKAVTDGVYATDDIDGAASILDDQEIQFFKQRTDLMGVADVSVLSFGRYPSDTTSFTDAGSLLSQSFTFDPTYFAEDFVGASRTIN